MKFLDQKRKEAGGYGDQSPRYDLSNQCILQFPVYRVIWQQSMILEYEHDFLYLHHRQVFWGINSLLFERKHFLPPMIEPCSVEFIEHFLFEILKEVGVQGGVLVGYINMQYQTKPRSYADVNKLMEDSYYNYQAYQIEYGNIFDYEIITKIGKGKYSEVYTGINALDDVNVVIKALKPVKKSKMKREIKILKALNGHANIIELRDVVKDPASKTTCIIFDYIDNVDFRSLIATLGDMDVRFYMYELLKALDYCHSKGIMHRDVKPQNIIVNHNQHILKLIDWGLAQFYHMGQDYNVRVASRYFKGPELLVDYNFYDYSLDIWSTGAMFASMIFKKEPFFMGESNKDQLVKISQVLGTEGLFRYLKKYHLNLNEEYTKMIGKSYPKPWSKFIKPENQALCGEDALDLLSKMLVYDHSERIIPKEALQHKYFDPVRK